MECNRCLMDDGIEGIRIGESGQCGMCDAHDRHMANALDLGRMMAKIRADGKGREFDAILGISGGLDSSNLALLANRHGLRVLLVHFDNGFNTAVADKNIAALVRYVKWPLLRFHADRREYGRICTALLATGLPDADIANDLGMAKVLLDAAKQHRIRWVLNGHNFQYEGWNPTGWTYMDGRYLKSIAGAVPAYMHYGLLEQFRGGVKHARPYYAIPGLDQVEMRERCSREIGWESYGPKHAENEYTEWVGSVYLPEKHGIDKRRNYLSADVRCGRITKAEAREALKAKPEFDPVKYERVAQGLGFWDARNFEFFWRKTPASMDRGRFKSYRPLLRRFRVLVWAAMKMDLVPEAFYRKYCR